MPPSTDVTVAIVAYHHAFSRRLSTIGISMTSGGIGKNELSMNETSASAQGARSLAAMPHHPIVESSHHVGGVLSRCAGECPSQELSQAVSATQPLRVLDGKLPKPQHDLVQHEAALLRARMRANGRATCAAGRMPGRRRL